jgi:hypothetical protein
LIATVRSLREGPPPCGPSLLARRSGPFGAPFSFNAHLPFRQASIMEEQILIPQSDAMKRVAIPETVLFRELEGEAVLLALDSGKYFGLNEVGTRMWTLLCQHGEIEAACRALLLEYDVLEDRLREDLESFVETLASRGLVELR